ncbi:MAG: GNAT family N-acetyltransferase [Patescibacteria group bacterium]
MENPHLPNLRKRIAKAPISSGMYRWKDAKGAVLYVGKAVNLRERLKNYVQVKADLSIGPWKLALRKHLADVEWTVTNSDLEALILETNLIKTLKPKYNVMMKDDKNYVYLEVTVHDPCPRLAVVRQMENAYARYFGPFLSAWEVRRSLEFLQLLLNFECCKKGLDQCNRATSDSRLTTHDSPSTIHHPPSATAKPCIEYQIGKCNGLCIQAVSYEEYRRRIDLVMDFFKGNREPLAKKARELMAQAAADKKFERAAKLRDALSFMEHQKEGQIVSDPHGKDLDVIGVALSNNRSVAVVLKVREGKMIGEEKYPLQGQPDSIAEALDAFLPQYAEAQTDLPPAIVISNDFPDRLLLEAWCTSRTGRRLRIIVPERGKKSHLLDLAVTNAQEKLRAQETAWETAARNLEDALKGLQDILKLLSLPKRIEGYDISHLGGTETVGSMVVMENGKPANDQYRSFMLRTVKEGEVDDYKSLREVLKRRLRHLTQNVRLEEIEWKKHGISFGKARKGEAKAIEEIMTEHSEILSNENIDYRQFFIARKDNEIIALARLVENPGKVLEIKSVWVDKKERGQKLGQFMVRKILYGIKKEKVYVIIDPQSQLEEYYGDIGFRHVHEPPDVLQKKTEQFCKEHPEAKLGIIMVRLPSEGKTDTSLSARPDLLVIDGGKGQLSAALDAMEMMKITLPVISLAKKQEEVFIPGHKDPVIFPNESPAKYLLMRLRDEAHRFSNRHREKRLKHKSVGSALDEIPVVGPLTKSELLKRFGTIVGIREAGDEELMTIVNAGQLKALRETL